MNLKPTYLNLSRNNVTQVTLPKYGIRSKSSILQCQPHVLRTRTPQVSSACTQPPGPSASTPPKDLLYLSTQTIVSAPHHPDLITRSSVSGIFRDTKRTQQKPGQNTLNTTHLLRKTRRRRRPTYHLRDILHFHSISFILLDRRRR
jgi:hypothetical protein